jgi:glycosyltransferase involved in cell wall biosynthesis
VAITDIAYLTPLYFDELSCLGGGERYPLNLARGLVRASRGQCRVRIVSFGDAARLKVLAPGVQLEVLPVNGRPAQPLDVVSWKLPAAIADADIVHIHQAFTRFSEAALLAARQQQKWTCITDHGGHTSMVGVQAGSIELADRVLCYSDFGASLFDTQVPIEIVKGGVDEEFFTVPPGRSSRRDHVLFVGRLLPHKGVDVLLENLPQRLPLVVCGRRHDDKYFQYLLSLAKGKRVEFVTDADDEAVRDLYRRAIATVLPSVYRDCYGNNYLAPELMGFTLMESMACGTPAICSRVGAMPEFVDHGVTGFVFDEPGELGLYLERLASNPQTVRDMAAQARQSIEQKFGLRVVAAKILAIYHSLREQGRREAA